MCLLFLFKCGMLFAVFNFSVGKAIDYIAMLHHQGYIESQDMKNGSIIIGAIRDFQNFVGIPNTGILDEETKSKLSQPRCGKPANVKLNSNLYVWPKQELTYKIINTTELISKSDIKRVIEEAITSWTKDTILRISESDSNVADIKVYFSKQDGEFGTLGYAYFPTIGAIYFDSLEKWTLSDNPQIDQIQFQWVALHELGHSLGLDHENDRSSIMHAYYSENQLTVTEMDKKNLKDLYKSVNNSALCDNPVVDTLLSTPTGEYILIQGENYWQINENGLQSGPLRVSERYPGLPKGVRAGFSRKKNTYFFKKNVFYKYSIDTSGYVRKLISTGFGEIPDEIDSTLHSSTSDTICFFKGNRFFLYSCKNTFGKRLLKNGKMSKLGISGRINAAVLFQNTNRAMFITENNKYQFYNMTTRKMHGELLDLKTDFFKC